MPEPFPTPEQERQMLADVEEARPLHKTNELAYRLSVDVRHLVAEVARLRRYERVISDMAAQICSPATTAEQFVAQQLGEPMPGRRASR